MGRSSSEILDDLECQRNAVEERIQRLNRRVREDASNAGGELRGEFERVLGRDSAAAEHPKALVAGAAGAGIALGMISESIGLARPHLPSRNGHAQQQSSENGRPVSGEPGKRGLLAVASGALAGSFRGPLNELIADAWKGFRSGFNNSDKRADDDAEPIAPDPHHMTREEIQPMSSDNARPEQETDAELHRREDEEARKTLHDAEVEDLNPRADNAVVSGVLGGGAIVAPIPDRDGPLDERRSGQ